MSFGIAFGSIGDLIAVGQIAWSLAKSLSSTRGSAKEYQGLVKELETFNNVLLQIVALWQNYESSPELDELGKVTKHAVEGWRNLLCEFLLKFEKKYGASLRPGGSGNWAKDTSKKFLWLKEKDDVVEFGRKIQSATDKITLLVLAAIGKSNKLDHKTQTIRIQAVYCLLKESVKLAEEQISRLKNLDEKVDAQARSSELILTKVTSSISSLTQVKSIAIDIKRILEFLKAQMSMAETTPRGLDTHWKQPPVTLEDALGNLIPIPLELVNSWHMFENLLTIRFEKLKGHKKVLYKEYAIEDSRSGQEVSNKKEWSMCFRPGMKVNMSMIFKQGKANTSCPGCQTNSESPNECEIECKKCGLWFRRVEEIIEPSQRPFRADADIPKLRAQSPPPKFQAAIPEIIEDSASDFKRVRLLFQKYHFTEDAKRLKPIRFTDPIGRKFSFPFYQCRDWHGMEQLIRQSCEHLDGIGPYVVDGHYDLLDDDGKLILPQDWETTVEPGVSVTMSSLEVIVRKKLVKERERSYSPRHKLHLAEGALAGAGAAALIRNHRGKTGNGHEQRGRKILYGAALGALGAELATRSRSRLRDESRDVSRSRSRSSSESGHRTKAKTGLALAARPLAAAAAAKYISNRNEGKEELARGRSRTRSVSRRRRYFSSSDDDAAVSKHNDLKHRAAAATKAGAAAATIAGVLEHFRNKSRGRSKSRLRTTGIVASAGLSSATVASLYEARKAKQDAADAAERGRDHTARSLSKSRSIGGYSDHGVDPEPGMVEYGEHPVHSDPAAAAAERNRERRRSRSRSKSRVGDFATGALATGAAAISLDKYKKRKERKEAERERRRYEEPPPVDNYYADQSDDDGYSPSPPRASGGAFYPGQNYL